MATKDRKKLQHIHSSIADKQPTPQSLEVGEIAVNNSAKKEFLSIKNSDDKVVRFSSDSTIIDWIEKKEVMPYSGVVDNVHLDTNRSNIEIKINQVAAKNTPKYDKINGAVDIDGQPVNPSTDGGKTDGAGIAIDMSRYAMIGANPSFSSITVTDKSDLSGNTTIANGDGTGTRIGHTLAIKTTDVTANDTNWTETITNRTSTITNETNKITTLNESATTRTTIVGTENLTVSGATTENKTGNVIENNFSDKTESTAGATNITRTGVVTEDNKNNVTRATSGSTTETFKGQVTENNQSGYTVNTTGNVIVNTTGTTTETKASNVTEKNLADKAENTTGAHSIYSTGNTCINSQANANFYGKVNTNIGIACDGTTKGSATTVVGTTTLNMSGATTTISGNTTNVTGATTLNLSGNTTNKRALTANTTSTSAYTSATTATTIIGTANTSATTATLSGNTLDITEATRLSAKTPSTYVSGTSLSVVETNTDIESCGRISGKTNAFTIQECAAGNGKTVINQTDIKASGKTLSFDETTSISAKTPSTTLSGTSLDVTEATSTINSTDTNLNGTNLSISETNTTINSCGKIEVTTDKYTLKQCSNTGGTAEFEFCNEYIVKSNAINLQQCGTAGTISITAQTQNINGGNLTVNESGNTAINTNGTTNIKSTGNTNVETNGANNKVTIQASGTGGDVEVFAKDTLNETGGTVNITSTNNTNISAKDFCVKGSTSASIGAPTTNIGKACDNSTATTINISGTTINEGGTTNNNNFTTINNTATTINNKANFNITGTTYISGNTTISGDTTIGGKLYLKPDCTGITSTTVNASLCEVLNRSAITIEKNTNPSDTRLATVYTIKQNGVDINTIEVAKDKALKSASVVQDTSGEWVIRLVWYTFDPDSRTESETTTDIPAKELVKDLEAVNPSDNGTAANHNVKLSVWYDATSGDNKISAETTPNMHVTNMYASNTVSGATVSGTTVKGATVSAGTLTATGNTTLAATSASSISATSVTSPTISGTNITASAAIRANNVSANTISANTRINTANLYATDTVSGTNVSAQTINATSTIKSPVISGTNINGVSINGTNISGTTVKGDTISGTNITASNKVTTNALDTNGNVNLSNIVTIDTAAGQCVTVNRNLCVNGVVTAQQQIYSSDRNLKENISLVTDDEMDRVANINYKSYNFKNDENKSKIYGVIAQDVQDAGLNELVYTNEDGNLAVDYTSLMILKLAHLRKVNDNLVAYMSNVDYRIAQLEKRIKELEEKNK